MTKKKAAPVVEPGELWEQLPEETVAQFEKFCAYRDMRYFQLDKTGSVPRLDLTVRRSLRGMARAYGFKRQNLDELSARYSWVERAEAYDKEILRKLKAKNENDIVRMKEKHAMTAAQMLNKAARRMLAIPEDDISAADLVRWFETAVKIERLSRGEATEHQQVTGAIETAHTGRVDLSALTVEDLQRLAGMGGGNDGAGPDT